MEEQLDRRLSIRIDPSLKRQFDLKVESEGKTVTNVVIGMIRNYLSSSQDSVNSSDIQKRIEVLERAVLGESLA